MKTRCLLALLSTVPAQLTAAAPAPPLKAEFVDPASKEAAEVRRIGDNAINRLAMTMINELKVAIAKGGFEAAFEVAHLKNLPMTGNRITGLPQIAAVKRTSFRLRNPANAPDAADQLALERVQHDLATDFGPPKLLVQLVEVPGAPPEWRVYKPLGVLPVCLRCHGAPDEQSPELRAKLAAAYPADQALGYRVGEWRGLMRVTVDLAPPAPPKPAPPAGKLPAKKS